MNVGAENNSLLMRLLDATVERDRVIAANIANINTPGYRGRELSFEEEVRAALESGDDLGAVAPQITVDETTPTRVDGNNVRLEDQVAKQRENRLLYETYVTMLQGRLGLIDSAIRGTGT